MEGIAARSRSDAARAAARAALARPSTEEAVRPVLDEAERLRRLHWGRRVRLHRLANIKAGACTEDCAFCAQSVRFRSPIARWNWVDGGTMLAEAARADAASAAKVCYVAAVRGPTDAEVDRICEAVREVKARFPRLKVCLSLGLLKEGQAERLAAAGVDRYNHNLETSERFFPNVTSTHRWRDRYETIRRVRAAGIEACSGGIVGMGETDEDLADLAASLAELEVESVPVNFLVPRPGTPFEGRPKVAPWRALKALAAFRLALPEVDLRVAAGREAVLGEMWPEALCAANSFFTDGYLTTPGTPPAEDAAVLARLGYEVERA